jgi:hypothetical protein
MGCSQDTYRVTRVGIFFSFGPVRSVLCASSAFYTLIDKMRSSLLYSFILASTGYCAVPVGDGLGDWSSAYSKAENAISGLSLSDKVGIVTGLGWQGGPCVGMSVDPQDGTRSAVWRASGVWASASLVCSSIAFADHGASKAIPTQSPVSAFLRYASRMVLWAYDLSRRSPPGQPASKQGRPGIVVLCMLVDLVSVSRPKASAFTFSLGQWLVIRSTNVEIEVVLIQHKVHWARSLKLAAAGKASRMTPTYQVRR